ncbi:nitronate monooxygenase [Aromatoleum toluclasticum]|uniref:NAD(P)H-dependent flavin oxidoreductase n=1 Tax=Aromatoleum toluclasticum TaxID=92003 RepID=UPI001D17F6E3|nr:nitronate monooxygenase [Aromatoleum toluclasticum]MCC4117602.1 nitronate monooxygenase [Aromatoleum toluclasticum]
MPIPEILAGRLSLPLICSPMFLASGPELVIAQCKAGVVGTFPTLNARPSAALDDWLERIRSELEAWNVAHPDKLAAPFGANLILHKSNPRQEEDLGRVVEHEVPIVITSVGRPDRVVEKVHGYGGIVLHDVISVAHARKAIDCGVDALILVCAGAGGHGGTLSPFAFVSEVREFWDGPLVLAGAISSGRSLRAAEVLGADLGYMGTRFLATREAAADPGHKAMIVRDTAADILYTPAFSGISANYLRNSVIAAGIDPAALVPSENGGKDDLFAGLEHRPKAWKDVWSAGQGIGAIHDAPSVAELVARLRSEYLEACATPVCRF